VQGEGCFGLEDVREGAVVTPVNKIDIEKNYKG